MHGAPDNALSRLDAARAIVHVTMLPTPQIHWPLLSQRAGCEVWVKHENHTPIGAFKLRGGLVYMARLAEAEPDLAGVVSATRGNHGQSIALAARRHGLRAVIVVPEGNSREKNAAMRALGAELVVAGHDFQAALEHARELAVRDDLHFVPSFHDWLVEGVASYALEFFRGAPPLDRVYVPIGLGSGICAVIAARDALGLSTEVIGVVAEGAPAYALSFDAGAPVATNAAVTMADGVACRVPVDDAVSRIVRGAARVVLVSDDAISAAMRHLFTDTHNVAEGAGAVALAGLLNEPEANAGARVGVVLSGGNIDMNVYRDILTAGGDDGPNPEARET